MGITYSSDSCSQFGIMEAVEFLGSAGRLWPLIDSGVCEMKEFLFALVSLSLTLLRLLLFSIVCVIKMGTGTMPALLSLLGSVYEFHRTQLTLADVIFETLFFTCTTLVFLYNKQILEYLWRIEKRLQRTSKEATKSVMRVAPHMAFFFLALIVSLLGRKFLKPLSGEGVLPLFSLVIPILRTVYGSLLMSEGEIVLGEPRPLSSSSTIGRRAGVEDKVLQSMGHAELEILASSGRRTILLWIVLAIYHSGATFLGHMPLVNHILWYLPFLREMVLVVLVWAQLSPVFIEIVYESTASLLNTAGSLIPSSRAEEERGMVMVSFLRGFGLINESTESFFKALCVEGTSFVLIIIFCFIPSPSHVVAHCGMIIISLLLPAVRAAGLVDQWDIREAPATSSGGSGDLGSSHSSTGRLVETASSMLANLGRSLSFNTDATSPAQGDMQPPPLSGSSSSYGGGAGSGDANSGTPQECTFNVGVFTTGRKVRKPSVFTIGMILKQKRWLEYFTCIAVIWLLRCYQLPLWPSVTMMISWYLSHSLWAGARPWSRYIVKGARLGLVLLTPIALFRMLRGAYIMAEKVVTPKEEGVNQESRALADASSINNQGTSSSTSSPKRAMGSFADKDTFSPQDPFTGDSTLSAPASDPLLSDAISSIEAVGKRQSLSLSTPRLREHEIANIDSDPRDSGSGKASKRRSRSSSRNWR